MDGGEDNSRQAGAAWVEGLERELAAAKDALAFAQAEAATWRETAHATHAVALGTMLGEFYAALGYDPDTAKEGPIEHARRVGADRERMAASLIEMRARAEKAEGERTVRDQVIADFRAGLAEVEIKWSADTARANAAEAELDAARRDLAEERGAAIAAEARSGQAALDLVAERQRTAAEVESLKAGLRALADVRDEGAAETHRWRDRALAAERDAKNRNDEVGLWRTRALEAEAIERAGGDELFAKSLALVDQVEVLRVAVRAARARAQKAERSAEGHHNDADVLSGDLDVAIAERDDARAEIDRLRGLIAQVEEGRAAVFAVGLGLSVELTRVERDAARRDLAEERGAAIAADTLAATTARYMLTERQRHAAEVESLKAGLRALANIRDEAAAETHRWRERALSADSVADDIESAVRRHLPVAEGYEDGDSLLRMVEAAGSAIEFVGKRVRAAWGELDTKATPSPVPYPGALRSGEGLAEAIRAQLAALRGERDDLVVQLGAKTREVEIARAERDAARHTADDIVRFAEADLVKARAERDLAVSFAVRGWRDARRFRSMAASADHLAQTYRTELDAAWRATGVQGVLRGMGVSLGDVIEGRAEKTQEVTRELETIRADLVAIRTKQADRRRRDEQAWVPRLANEVRDGAPGYPTGAPDPEPAVKPVEAPQATETQPDPGEGWRLLGPEEMIEKGDEWRSDGVRDWVRRIAAPAPEPRFEHVVEERGTRFVIVRREVKA